MADNPSLTGRNVLITGASRNIGRAIALQLAQLSPDKVTLWAKSDSLHLRNTAHDIESLGIHTEQISCDLADGEAVKATATRNGPFDVVICSAAVRPSNRLEDLTIEQWDHVFAINVRAPFLISQAMVPSMRANRWGRIVFISGLDAHWGNLNKPHVVASKAALEGLARALALEVADEGYDITVNCVAPGVIDTERDLETFPGLEDFYLKRMKRIPLARLGRAEEVAGTVAFLVSSLASYITGQTIFVSGGAIPLAVPESAGR